MRRTVFLASLLILLTAGFAAAVTFSSKFYSTPGPGTGVISGDFNRDGRPDVAVVAWADENVTVMIQTP